MATSDLLPEALLTEALLPDAPLPEARRGAPAARDDAADEDPMRWFAPDRLDATLTVHEVDPTSDLGVEAERFVYRIFRVSGFCAESDREHVEETEPWRAGSRLHVICDGEPDRPGGPEIVGVARTVVGRYDELPVSQFRADIALPDGPLCEIGSLAVRPSQRGLGVANELHRRALWRALREDASGVCFLIDEWMFDFFRSHYGLPVRALAAPRRYMGGDVIPTGFWLPEMLHVLDRERPNVYRWTVDGLDPALHFRYELPIILT